MGSRISPESNRIVLHLRPRPIATVPEVGHGKIPAVNLMIGSKPAAVKVTFNVDWTDVVVATPAPAPAAEMEIGYRAGGAKMESLIPKRRKLVKTMIYHSIKGFVKSLFAGTPPYSGAGAPSPP